MEKIFTYEKYTHYLKDLFLTKKKEGLVGLGQKLATAINCHPSLVSQILKGNAHLSLEQSVGVAEYLKLSALEKDYFVNLVLFERAANKETKDHFRKRLDELIESHLSIKTRWSTKDDLIEKFKSVYFSSWQMQSVHALTQIESMQLDGKISDALNLPNDLVIDLLTELESMGLVKKEKSKWISSHNFIHLEKDSLLIKTFHLGWRHRAQRRLYGQKAKRDFHYSSLITFAEKDQTRLLDMILGLLEQIRREIQNSKSECANVFNIDFFELIDPL